MSYEVEELVGGEQVYNAFFVDAQAIAHHFAQDVEKVKQVCDWADEAPGVAQDLAIGPAASLVITAYEES